MTDLRPEPDAGPGSPYERGAYEAGASGTASAFEVAGFEDAGAFEEAVGRLSDPLNDPLPGPVPGQHTSPWFRADVAPQEEPGPGHGQERGRGRGQHRAPDHRAQAPAPDGAQPSQPPQSARLSQPSRPGRGSQETPAEWYDPEGFERDWYGPRNPAPEPVARAVPLPSSRASSPATAPSPVSPPSVASPAANDEAAGTRTTGAVGADDSLASTRKMPALFVPVPDSGPEQTPDLEQTSDLGLASDLKAASDPEAASDPDSEEPSTGGRAERRRAAKGRGRRRAEPPQESANPAPPTPGRPMSRVEARRAARAAKESPAVVASRVVGELFITLGVLMLLFVTYQLWWTNVRAGQYAGKETDKIQDGWAKTKGDRTPGAFEAGQGFAILHIPKLDVVAPIAEGISKEKVLDRGMVGHYAEGALRTAMPSDKQGNFAIAGHRNTHGEPFRYINQLDPGDPIVVETQDTYYTYEMTKLLPQTSPSNISVIGPVPPESGFTRPGRYLTLTTCTPEFTSTYRLIVWGKMVDERPRSKGKPDALLD
ncbi:class E sortase [Streptomyces sp. NPDC047985]|uniref:class E sortase n=1 Tax=unclassified Streptomyces TaxID=2593676 RepID=UPI003437BF2B